MKLLIHFPTSKMHWNLEIWFHPTVMRWWCFVFGFVYFFYERGQHCYTTLNISYELFTMNKSCPGNVRGSIYAFKQLQWRDNERDGVSNHQRFDCLINRLFRRRSKKTLKLWVTVLCEENPPVTSKTKNVFIWSLIIANDLYNVINP